MNQEKIGRFIAQLRKEKNMTQNELASKLGITDRAISKWENGRGMPDLSLLKDLSTELNITINELLSGEKIDKKEYQSKLEENILNTIDYSSKKIISARKTLAILFTIIGAIVLLFILLYFVDMNCIKNNKPVLFSTWGYDYVPPINLNNEKIELAITEYLINNDSMSKYPGEKKFVSYKTYLIAEKESNKLYNIYSWVLEESYYLDGDAITLNNASSTPQLFVIKRENNNYRVIDVKTPREGSLYSVDMNDIFPKLVIEDMNKAHDDGTIEGLKLNIENQVNVYFHKKD